MTQSNVSQLSVEILRGGSPPVPPPPPPPAPVEAWICDSLASYFYVLLCDVYGTVIALFDNFEKLEYSNVIDDVGYFSLTINADDPRVGLFALDGIVKVRRSIPGLGLDWYDDFIGLYRTPIYELGEDGREMFTAIGVSTNDMLRRTVIGYKAGTIRAAKNIASETAMKEYVHENCGIGATIALGRQADGVLPGFVIDPDLAYGYIWSGDMAGANLLDILRDIASYSNIDFEVKLVTNHYVFYTYPDQYGLDRTVVGLDPYTGKNAAGNYPVIFSKNFSNIKSLKCTYDRIPEVNRVFMLGKGDGSTRVWQTVTAASVLDSIYNRREASRAGSNQEFLYQLTQAGVGELSAGMAKLEIQFVPFQQPSCAYGKHYRVGDRVSLIYRGITLNYKLMACKVNVGKGEESLDIIFANEVLL